VSASPQRSRTCTCSPAGRPTRPAQSLPRRRETAVIRKFPPIADNVITGCLYEWLRARGKCALFCASRSHYFRPLGAFLQGLGPCGTLVPAGRRQRSWRWPVTL
jgi:hypothetical protein